MITLYGCLRSRASRPWWLLTEAGADFTHEPVIQAYRLDDPAAPEAPFNTASPGFVKINPQGQIPALVDGGLVLTESLAITLYLARKLGGALGPGDLGPGDLGEEGQMLQWAFLAGTAVEAPALDILFTVTRGEPDTDAGQARIATATGALARPCARIEAHLAESGDWLVGGRFTVADIALSECLRYAQPHPPALAAFPLLRAWLARCHARPAFQAMMRARDAEPA